VDKKIIVRLVTEGTLVEELDGFLPTGNKIKVSSIYIITIINKKIVELRADVDMLGFYQQLGMELKPEEVE
jgi:predicted ester cyclase